MILDDFAADLWKTVIIKPIFQIRGQRPRGLRDPVKVMQLLCIRAGSKTWSFFLVSRFCPVSTAAPHCQVYSVRSMQMQKNSSRVSGVWKVDTKRQTAKWRERGKVVISSEEREREREKVSILQNTNFREY